MSPMDLKREAARLAFSLVENNSSLGLGDGSAVLNLAAYLLDGINQGLKVNLYTSSFKTQQFLEKSGIMVNDISQSDSLHQYFDGCDQVDGNLNVLKSGSGIHTQEKLLASMANHFFILADESKFVTVFDSRFPLVLEVLPQAVNFVMKELKTLYSGVKLVVRRSAIDENVVQFTRNGNYLIDCFFPEWPETELVQHQTRMITGVIEISLFYKIADEALIAGKNGVSRYQRKKNQINKISDHPLELL
jgi:ribose 5-phosphate isomerase A